MWREYSYSRSEITFELELQALAQRLAREEEAAARISIMFASLKNIRRNWLKNGKPSGKYLNNLLRG